VRIAISGLSGFLGTHLHNFLRTRENIQVIPIDKEAFQNADRLSQIVSGSDVIVHLAGVNRHDDADHLYHTNIHLVELLIASCIQSSSIPYIIFASSTQEEHNNPYGKSKAKGQELFEDWVTTYNGTYAGLVIPNIFGPFGKPNYNSIVATFCHKIGRGEQPSILEDKSIRLIYVNEVVKEIWELMKQPKCGRITIQHQVEIKVSQLLEILQNYGDQYLLRGEIPPLSTPFELALFNTFRCYLPVESYPMKLKRNIDARGVFVEIARNNSGGQFSFSTTKPGITRGNHFHTRKMERFAVIHGEAKISLRRIDQKEVVVYQLNGEQPAFVDIPIWHTHKITNIGDQELITLFWINEPYLQEDPDTYFLEV